MTDRNTIPRLACRPRHLRGAALAAAPRLARLALAALAIASGGCAAYRFGSASLFPPDIQTVYVPVFESNSFRRGLAEWLTEAVIKEIELRTPYKVVSGPEADSVLSGRILNETKRVIVEDPNDQPRETEYNLVVEVRWVNRKGQLVGNGGNVPIPQSVAQLSQTGMLVPEFGQSTVTSEQESIQKMARQIVALMETPW